MNVIISNQQDNITNSLNVEVIKSIHGEFDVEQIIANFSNFFFSRMIIDVTALKDYTNILTYQKLSIGLPVDKIILIIPSSTEVASSYFLSKLISMGFYNFTTNSEGVLYLLQHPNSYKDVAHLHQIDATPPPVVPVMQGNAPSNTGNSGQMKIVIGIKNVTEGAGATTLTYMLYKELVNNQKISATAVEVNKKDFLYFNDKEMLSTNKTGLSGLLLKINSQVVLVDLNDAEPDLCTDVLYLVEPSLIKMNKLMMKNRMIFSRIAGKKIVLNKCCLTKSDIREFEKECGSRLFDVIPPFDDRSRQDSIINLLARLGLVRRK